MARNPSQKPDQPEAARPAGGLPDDPTPLPERYEDALSELEGLVAQMEAGQLPLDQLLTTYQRGARLLQFCRGRLEAVETQVKVLENGQLKPWDGA